MALTDLQVRKITPKSERFELLDGNGLYIRVMPTGKKSWVFRYNFEGTPRRMTIGGYPAFSLPKARERHALAMQDIEMGIDPGLKAKEAKAKRKAAPTIQDLLDEFFDEELGKTPSGNERKRLMDKDIIPAWKNKKVASITRRDAVLILDKVRKRAPVGANRLQGVLVRMFNFASERGMIDFSPLMGMRRKKESSRSRVLTDAEIKTIWNCLEIERVDIDIYHLTKLALKAILLTGQRPGEVAGMAWDEIDGDCWVIPQERTKTGIENRVPILPLLADIIEQAKPYSTGSKFVFVSPHSPLYEHKKPDKAKPKESDIPVSVGAMANAIRRHRAEMKIDHFTPHDLRRTLRTKLAELGVSDMIGERVLNHKLQGVLGIYNRHSYDMEKRQALGLWERRLVEILGDAPSTSNNVIRMEARHV